MIVVINLINFDENDAVFKTLSEVEQEVEFKLNSTNFFNKRYKK